MKKFRITCEMKERWIPHFLGMLKQMERLGNIGSSRSVAIYADGDGDFRPIFKWKKSLGDTAKPSTNTIGDTTFDAG